MAESRPMVARAELGGGHGMQRAQGTFWVMIWNIWQNKMKCTVIKV